MRWTPRPDAATLTLWLLPAVAAVLFQGCWSNNYARGQRQLKPPSRPLEESPPALPGWAPNKSGAKGEASLTPTGADYHLSILPGPVAISIRKQAPYSNLLTDRATIRVDLRVGIDHGMPALAELAAMSVLELPDGPNNQPDLRTVIADLGGSIAAEVGANWTRFTATVPSINWQNALSALTDRLRRPVIDQRQFNNLQTRLVERYTADWTQRPLLSMVSQWMRYGDLGFEGLVQAIEDRNLPEFSLFQQRHYQPRGVAIGLWIPNSPKNPKFLVNQALAAVKAWQPGPVPPDSSADTTSPSPRGVRWAEGASEQSEIALIVPLAPATPEWLTLLECFTMDGIGGRLGTALEASLGQEFVLQRREIGNYNKRHVLLVGQVPAEKVPAAWSAAQAAWESLVSNTPEGAELKTSAARARLRIQRRQDHPDSWFEAMGLSMMRGQTSGPVQDLASVDSITKQGVATAAREHASRPIAMMVAGGSIPKVAAKLVKKVSASIPDYSPATNTVKATGSAQARQYLNLAIQALGDPRQFRIFKGYRCVESWTDQDDLSAKVETSYHSQGRMQRHLRVLNSSIHSSAQRQEQGVLGEETAGGASRKLSPGEARDLLGEVASHPIALIAQFVRGQIKFRYLGVRTLEGRRVALLERDDDAKPRLRITIDARTGLLRTVETTLHRAGVGLVQLRESYDDYRRVTGLRVPMHRVSSVDGKQTSESTCTEFAFLN